MTTMKQTTRKNGFTLVELLVVIGIIALLISILLPALTKARKSANTVRCAANLHMIGLAVIGYTQDNKGRLMPGTVPPINASLYPNGFYWATELVLQKYITAPYVTLAANGQFNAPAANSVFKCPEGIDTSDLNTTDSTSAAQGNYPTDAKNNSAYCPFLEPNSAGINVGIASWYQLNARITGFASNYTSGGVFNPPFVYFPSGSDSLGEAESASIVDINYSRRLSMIRQPAVTVMIGEASDPNWVTQTPTAAYPGHYAKRMSARHGTRSTDGTNAYTNFAFFDGHVALFPTKPIDSNNSTNPSGQPGVAAMGSGSGTIFTLFNQ